MGKCFPLYVGHCSTYVPNGDNVERISSSCMDFAKFGRTFSNQHFLLTHKEKRDFGVSRQVLRCFWQCRILGNFFNRHFLWRPWCPSRGAVLVTKCNLLAALKPSLGPRTHCKLLPPDCFRMGHFTLAFCERFTLFPQNCLFFNENL